MSAVADVIRAEVIPHIDDIGVTLGSVTAMDELAGSGFVTSGSIMVPCPWFPAAAELAARAVLPSSACRLSPLILLGASLRSSPWRQTNRARDP